MHASARYGALLGGVVIPFLYFGPRPIAQLVVGALLVTQLVVASALTWRRTGLRLASTAMAIGALGAALLAFTLSRTPDLLAAPPVLLVGLAIAVVLGPLLLLVQSRTAPSAWRQWGQHLQSASVSDFLAFRHIPVFPDRAV